MTRPSALQELQDVLRQRSDATKQHGAGSPEANAFNERIATLRAEVDAERAGRFGQTGTETTIRDVPVPSPTAEQLREGGFTEEQIASFYQASLGLRGDAPLEQREIAGAKLLGPSVEEQVTRIQTEREERLEDVLPGADDDVDLEGFKELGLEDQDLPDREERIVPVEDEEETPERTLTTMAPPGVKRPGEEETPPSSTAAQRYAARTGQTLSFTDFAGAVGSALVDAITPNFETQGEAAFITLTDVSQIRRLLANGDVEGANALMDELRSRQPLEVREAVSQTANIVPFVGTIRNWEQLSPPERVALLIVDSVAVSPAVPGTVRFVRRGGTLTIEAARGAPAAVRAQVAQAAKDLRANQVTLASERGAASVGVIGGADLSASVADLVRRSSQKVRSARARETLTRVNEGIAGARESALARQSQTAFGAAAEATAAARARALRVQEINAAIPDGLQVSTPTGSRPFVIPTPPGTSEGKPLIDPDSPGAGIFDEPRTDDTFVDIDENEEVSVADEVQDETLVVTDDEPDWTQTKNPTEIDVGVEVRGDDFPDLTTVTTDDRVIEDFPDQGSVEAALADANQAEAEGIQPDDESQSFLAELAGQESFTEATPEDPLASPVEQTSTAIEEEFDPARSLTGQREQIFERPPQIPIEGGGVPKPAPRIGLPGGSGGQKQPREDLSPRDWVFGRKQGIMYVYTNHKTGKELYSRTPLFGKVPNVSGRGSAKKSRRAIQKGKGRVPVDHEDMGAFSVRKGRDITFKRKQRGKKR